MMTQSAYQPNPVLTKTAAVFPKIGQKPLVILLFITVFFLCQMMSIKLAEANSFPSSNTPGMFMAKIVFKIDDPDSSNTLSADQLRFQLMNSSGDELMHVKSEVKNFDFKIGFPYGKKDPFVKTDNHSKTPKAFIAGAPKTYEQALAKYKRALDLYKSASSSRQKKQALAYMKYCHKLALALYHKKISALKTSR